MRAFEFLDEQGTIGTSGSTTGTPNPVGAVSQTSTQQSPGTTSTASQANQTLDPKMQQLAGTLRQHNVIGTEKDVNNFLSAYQAQTQGKNLDPQQQASMAKLAGVLMKNKNLSTNLDFLIKNISQQKPGQQV